MFLVLICHGEAGVASVFVRTSKDFKTTMSDFREEGMASEPVGP